MGAAIAVPGPVLASLGVAGAFPLTLLSMFTVLGLALVAFGGFWWAASRKLRPMRFYENGIDIPAISGRPVFYSYGELTEVGKVASPVAGPVYAFRTRLAGQTIAVRKDMTGFADLLGRIREKLGREEFVVELEPTPADVKAERKIEYSVYAAVVVAGTAVGAAFSAVVNPGDPLGVFLSGFGLITPFLVMTGVTAAAYGLKQTSRAIRGKLNIKIPLTIVVVMLAYFVASQAVFSNAFGPSSSERHIGPKPASTSVDAGVYANQTIRAEGPVLVDSAETLELRNSTLILNSTADGEYGIWVAQGGRLILSGSAVLPADPRFLYTFEVMGSALIRNTTISGLWAEWDDYDGGLEIYSDDVTIEGARIQGARETAILVVGASPLIANSTVEGAGDDGIELQSSGARVLNNVITGCEWAMYVYGGSQPLIEGNLISRNSFGLLILDSSPVIRNNTFEYNEHIAVSYREPSSPVLSGNRYVSNGENVVREANWGFLDIWTISTAVAMVLSILVLSRVNRQSRRKSDTPRPGR